MGTTAAACHEPLEGLVHEVALTLAEHFDRNHETLWRFAVRLTADPDEAHDAVQETFLRALKARLPAEPRAAEAWLMQTLVNYCRDRHRWRRVRRLYQERVAREEKTAASTDPEAAAHAQWELDRAIRTLGVRRRAILVLRELEGRSVRDIANALGLREPTVRWHLAAAKRELRKALGTAREEAHGD